jgi:hypothetical protein
MMFFIKSFLKRYTFLIILYISLYLCIMILITSPTYRPQVLDDWLVLKSVFLSRFYIIILHFKY